MAKMNNMTIRELLGCLVDRRRECLEEVAEIDALLVRYDVKVEKPAAAAQARGKTGTGPVRRSLLEQPAKGVRGTYPTHGSELVLNFIKEKINPTTADIGAHWKSEGRRGKVYSVLNQLVETRKLKRIENKGGRGSKYTLP